LKHAVKYYYHCNSSNNQFAYFKNSDKGQPCFKYKDCLLFFTFGLESNCPRGRKHGKKKVVDPEDIWDLPQQCPKASCVPFKYYNHKSKIQPCFKCLHYKQLFHMHIIINGTKRYLVHSKPHTSRTKSIKPPKITSGSNRPRKPNHVQNGLLNVDMLPNEMHEHDMAHSTETNNGGMEDITLEGNPLHIDTN
jgi:hypothetical protein